MASATFDDPRLIDAFTSFETRLYELSKDARTPDQYILALRKSYDEATDPAVRAKILEEYVKPAGSAVREWARLQEAYRQNFGDPSRLLSQLENAAGTLPEDLRGVATNLADFRTFLEPYRQLQMASPGLQPSDIAGRSTAIGLWAATLADDPGKRLQVETTTGVTPTEVMVDGLDRKLKRAPREMRERVESDPDFKDLLSRYSRAQDLYLQMGAQRDQKASELLATGQAKSWSDAQGLIQDWLTDSHAALEGAERDLTSRFGDFSSTRLSTNFLPRPREARQGFLGVLEDAARSVLEAVAPVAGERASAMAGIMFPRKEPEERESISGLTRMSPGVVAALPPGVKQLAEMAIVPMNAQTITEDMAALLGPIGAQFKVASIPARAAGRAVAGTGARLLAPAVEGAVLFGGAEAVSPSVSLGDVGERAKRTALGAGIGAVGGAVVGGVKALRGKKAPAPTAEVPGGAVPETVRPVELPSPGLPAPISEQVSPTKTKMLESLKAAKPIRAEQEKLVSVERAIRAKEISRIGREVGGEEGLIQKLRFLKGEGELPKAQFESIRNQFSVEERRSMIDAVESSHVLLPYEKLAAQKALEFKLFAKEGAVVPTNSEIDLLGQVFGQDFAKEIASKMGAGPGIATQFISGMRSMMAMGELSGTLRQAAGLGPRFPRQWARSFKTQLNSLRSEKASKKFLQELQESDDFLEMKQSGLAMTSAGRGSPNLTAVEEDMLGANLVSEFLTKKRGPKPVQMALAPARLLGRYGHATNRAYNDLLTSLRAEVYRDVKKNTLSSGQEWGPETAKAVANTINTFSGRGSLGRYENAIGPLSTALFSPRYQASLLRQLDWRTYMKGDPTARKLALSSAVASTASYMTILGLASRIPGLDVEFDPKSSDFGKVRIGKTRIDPGRGFNQIARVIAQITTGKVKSATTGKTYKLGEGYKPRTKWDVVSDFALGKAAPLPSLIVEALKGTGFDGEPFNLPREIGERYTMMLAGDLVDIAKTDPTLLPYLAPLGYFGLPLQTFPVDDPAKEALQTAERLGKEDTLSVKTLRKKYNAARKLKGRERRTAMQEIEAAAKKVLDRLQAQSPE